MVNERYDNKGEDEGEYHFSDDQDNYELESDSSKESSGVSAVVAEKETFLTKFKSRKSLVGMIIFIILVAVVYQMLKPNSTVPPTEFSNQQTTNRSTAQPVSQQPVPQVTATAASVAPTQPSQPTQQMPVQSVPDMMGAAQQQNVPPPSQTAMTSPMANPMQEASSLLQGAVMQQQSASASNTQGIPVSNMAPSQQPPQSMTPPMQQPNYSPPPPTQQGMGGENSQSTAARLAALEQQISAMSAMLQAQQSGHAQANTAEDAELQNKVQELNTRVANMEVAFHQLTRILRNTHKQAAPGSNAAVISEHNMMQLPSMRPMQPRMSYTVQAIIPGRAWLKSDSGDTVTVAEGDTLKGYGRITKIDPYDGIVSIDTGNKIITLSYGSGGD